MGMIKHATECVHEQPRKWKPSQAWDVEIHVGRRISGHMVATCHDANRARGEVNSLPLPIVQISVFLPSNKHRI